MLYIASAQPPTPILQSLLVSDFTSSGSSSLVCAKPDRIEVWDVGPSGLVYQADLEVWGSVVGIEKVVVKDARPHILVLLGPPNAQLLVLTYNPSTSSLIVASSTLIDPPTPSLRLAEFYRGVVADGNTALISLWVGVLSCVELEVEKEKDLKRRRSSAVRPGMINESVSDKRLRVRETFNINVREQNLLSLAFHSGPPTMNGPIISILFLSPHNEILLSFRALSTTTQSLHDIGKALNVVSPQSPLPADDADIDYGSIPFSCPGGRHVIPAGTLGTERLFLVVGDEYSVLYSLNQIDRRESSQIQSSQSPATSPRASAVNRSPQSEMKQIGKRRKSSTTDGGRWQVNPVWRVRQGFGTVLSATTIESSSRGGKMLLSDDSGRLTAFAWTFNTDSDNNRTVNVGKADMGLASPASSLTPLSSNHLFCASACGDSTLLHLDIPSPGPPSSPTAPSSSPRRRLKGKGREELSSPSSIVVSEPSVGTVDVLERWVNLAPVKDFCAIGDQIGGTSHLVIASGSSNSNSLRVIRSGAGLERVAAIEGLEGVERVWSLDLTDGASSLLLSTATSTSLLTLSPEVDEIDLASNIASAPTLAAAVLPGTKSIVHVTATAITLWDDLTTGKSAAIWQAPGEITSAQIDGDHVVVSTIGGDVHVLKASSASLKHISTGNIGAEVSSVAILSATVPIIAVGTWTNMLSIYTSEQLSTGAGSVPLAILEESYFAASVLLRRASNGYGLQLLAGLSDGSLVTCDFDYETSATDTSLSLCDRKISSLGTRPLTLHPIHSCTASGDELLAIGLSDRTSIIFLNGDRIDFSSVSLTGLVAAATINTEQGQSLVLATPSDLSISQVDGLKKLHIQTLDTGYKSASKLAWSSTHRAIAAGVIERTINAVTGDYLQNAWVELRDQDNLQVLASMPLGLREEVSSLSAVLLNEHHYIAVGTALLPDDDELDLVYEENASPAKEGRLLLLDPVHDRTTDTWSLDIATEFKTVGAVNDITVIHEFLAYAAASKVSIMKFEDDSLTELSNFSSTFIAHSLFTAPPSKYQAEEKLIVGDGMRSVLMLEVDDESGMIYADDRDMATHQVVALAGIKDRGQGVVVADGSSNILTFRLRDKIESAATFGLHEQVVKFAPGAFAPAASAPDVITPDLIYATADGRLGMIGELSLPSAKILDDLQRNMDKFDKGPGGVSWRQFRRGGKPLVPRDTAGFIDGDFVQKFLNMNIGTGGIGEKVLKGGSVHEQVTRFGAEGKAEAASRGDVARVLEAAAGFH